MKRFAELYPGKQPYRGYLARCVRCGRVVVHADSTNEPFHMHKRSRLCQEAAARRSKS